MVISLPNQAFSSEDMELRHYQMLPSDRSHGEKNRCDSCPVALLINRNLKEGYISFIELNQIEIWDAETYAKWCKDLDSELLPVYVTDNVPYGVRVFINAFDTTVYPRWDSEIELASFDLRLPSAFLRPESEATQ